MSQDTRERFRIVQERDGQRSWTPLPFSDDEDQAHRELAWRRKLAPKGLAMWLERQDVTPRPWERLNA